MQNQPAKKWFVNESIPACEAPTNISLPWEAISKYGFNLTRSNHILIIYSLDSDSQDNIYSSTSRMLERCFVFMYSLELFHSAVEVYTDRQDSMHLLSSDISETSQTPFLNDPVCLPPPSVLNLLSDLHGRSLTSINPHKIKPICQKQDRDNIDGGRRL